AIAPVADPRRTCMHKSARAGLCVSHAARGKGRRQYDVEVPAAVDETTEPRLWRDGELLLTWTLTWRDGGRRLVDSPPYDDAPWRGGVFPWGGNALAPGGAQAAILLRPAGGDGVGRGLDPWAVDSAAELRPPVW